MCAAVGQNFIAEPGPIESPRRRRPLFRDLGLLEAALDCRRHHGLVCWFFPTTVQRCAQGSIAELGARIAYGYASVTARQIKPVSLCPAFATALSGRALLSLWHVPAYSLVAPSAVRCKSHVPSTTTPGPLIVHTAPSYLAAIPPAASVL